MFVKLIKGELIGDTWRFAGNVVNVSDERARSLIKYGIAKIDSGPENLAVPDFEEGVYHTGAKPATTADDGDPAKRGPGRPKKEA